MARDLSRGDVPTLILAVLVQGPLHGYGIARTIEATSAQVLQLREGSLYPALRGLEQQGFVESQWDTQESGPARKVYGITAAGRTELARRQDEWERYANAVDALLQRRRPSYDT